MTGTALGIRGRGPADVMRDGLQGRIGVER